MEEKNIELLKDYIKRLSNGESLESVRKDFVDNFSDVEAFNIMQAEQQLMKEGVPFTEVQKLCDVHSVLFHGKTREEKIANAEKEVEASAARVTSNITIEKREAARKQAEIVGHPLHLFTKENEALTEEINKTKSLIKDIKIDPSDDNNRRINESVDCLRKVAIHYAKKGDLLYPHMKAKYDISGPSDVMWSVDDEIRDELKFIADSDFRKIEYVNRLEHAITRMEEMIYKEQNILFPICTRFFTNEEWYQIYQDSKDYAPCLVDFVKWPEAEAALSKENATSNASEDMINLPGGHFTPAQLRAVLNTLPVEISFIDENDINCFFNEGPKLFKRAGMAIGRDVYSCHPPKIEMMVRSIIGDFKSGTRDKVSVWMEKEGIPVLVEYIAVRDDNGQYIGTMECVQKMDEAKKHFEK
ncbi:hypothetical protein SAMN02910384_03244 [Pseudobutyrivibrio sp. ACV-2]|uniref:DUF438 domain-containing protein n=1 Tax=Pseudobutyrivibrio sp. ACV-2 TaxID=1520801 RepID=UPI00089A2719|nr:DUF438 domain-containing protein [Pseudobutyrivibrio sp. ACV-2]SEB05730.1 hypothetical protein SAMN02910384_03244 [Pseudobutyrivibrio sp. ACV-2]